MSGVCHQWLFLPLHDSIMIYDRQSFQLYVANKKYYLLL